MLGLLVRYRAENSEGNVCMTQVVTFRWNEDEGKGYNVVQVFDMRPRNINIV